MRNIDRATKLNLFKLFSFLCFLFVVVVFINLMLNDDLDVSYLLKNKQKKEKENFDFCKNEEKKLFELSPELTCEKNSSKFTYVFALTENKFIYYSFALVLGGVLNSKNIIKIGIF